MVVYLVTEDSSCDDYCPVTIAVFSTKEKAQSFIKKRPYSVLDIEEMELDLYG
jgi:hypothetical protein